MSFLSGINPGRYLPYLNTGTIIDLVNGSFVSNGDGYVLAGGIPCTRSTSGRGNLGKSTLHNCLTINTWSRCPGAQYLLFDDENSQSRERLLASADVPIPSSNEFLITNQTEYYAEDIYAIIADKMEERRKIMKDIMVEIPIINPSTGKKHLMPIPVFFDVDSYSRLPLRQIDDLLSDTKKDINDKDKQTIFMKEGLAKKKMLSQWINMAARYGMYFGFTVHTGNRGPDIGGNPNVPPPKILPDMRQSDKFRGAGEDVTLLPSMGVDLRGAMQLISDDKTDAQYPDDTTGPTDQIAMSVVVVRGKAGVGSGAQASIVATKSRGIDSALTNYHLCRVNEYFGMGGKGAARNHSTVFTPDVSMQRTTVSTKIRDPKIARAVEILAQLCYINRYWTTEGVPIDITIPPEKLAEQLFKTTYAMDDILNSRGWWTYDDSAYPNPYLSLIDVIAIATNQYTPKYFPTK